jgi:(4-O-methyl)-D-glucuronate---lignin esterase
MPRSTTSRAALAALALSSAAAAFPKVADLPSRTDLPDPLVMLDGTKVDTRADWVAKRRPELKALFQYYMYGELPPAPPRMRATVEHEDRKAFDGKATLKEIALTFGSTDLPPIRLQLVVPNRRRGPAPVFVGLNFSGNHSLVSDPKVRVPTAWMYSSMAGVKDNHATEAGRNALADSWSLEQSIDRGYAVATFYNGDVDPDRPTSAAVSGPI